VVLVCFPTTSRALLVTGLDVCAAGPPTTPRLETCRTGHDYGIGTCQVMVSLCDRFADPRIRQDGALSFGDAGAPFPRPALIRVIVVPMILDKKSSGLKPAQKLTTETNPAR
jgi:hypothetical protein